MSKNPTHITLHWTAVNSDIVFKEYQFNIKKSGQVVQTLSVYKRGAHTWMRNTNNIGIAACGGPKMEDIQLERMSKLVAELMIKFNIPIENVRDHHYYAIEDKYEPEFFKIDLNGTKDKYFDKVLKKISWYKTKLENKEIKFEFSVIV